MDLERKLDSGVQLPFSFINIATKTSIEVIKHEMLGRSDPFWHQKVQTTNCTTPHEQYTLESCILCLS